MELRILLLAIWCCNFLQIGNAQRFRRPHRQLSTPPSSYYFPLKQQNSWLKDANGNRNVYGNKYKEHVNQLKTREKLKQSFPIDGQQYKGDGDADEPKEEQDSDGIEVFHSQKNYFKDKFHPENHQNHGTVTQIQLKQNKGHQNYGNHESDDEAEEEAEDFTPIRMFAQVRHHEDTQHLPASVLEPRLRKIVKDTRIHTVYTEEGYEDGAYDHAGEEKEAEEKQQHKLKRRKRSEDSQNEGHSNENVSENIEEINVSKDFVHEPSVFLPGVQRKENKYPYYGMEGIHKDSPLNYAQDFKDIPVKKGKDLAFYDLVKQHECEEVEKEVNPLPAKLENLENEEHPSSEVNDPKLPRLKNLGDKIDCYKAKLFGEDPLDNPLFKEPTVGPPEDIFKNVKITKNKTRSGKSVNNWIPIFSETEIITTKPDEEVPTTTTTETILVTLNQEEQLPEAEALRLRKRRRRPYKYVKPYSSYYNIGHKTYKKNFYDLNLPYLKQHVLEQVSLYTTVKPSLGDSSISEVYYKNQIKPSEQLNVFSDVINHIQNSTKLNQLDNQLSSSEAAKHFLPNKPHKRIRGPFPKIRIKPTTTNQKLYPQISYYDTKEEVAGTVVPSELYQNHFVGLEKSESLYSTIDVPMNRYLVAGMKPPLTIEKPLIYSDFLNNNSLKRRDWLNHRVVQRRKRSSKSYTEIRRQSTKSSSDEEDDYVPHRHTSYHYDPESGRIVYDKTTTPRISEAEEVDEDYEEIEDVSTTTTTKKPKVHRTVFLKDVRKEGPTLVDFLQKLKSDPNYKVINDPDPKEVTTTEKPTEVVSHEPPEFLKFIKQLHSDSTYKTYKDPEVESKTKSRDVEPKDDDEDEEVEEEIDSPVVTKAQNSPGGQFASKMDDASTDIEDDSLPDVKSYTPRTSIDYSKYKTIERTTQRHLISSKYNEDEDELPLKRPYIDSKPNRNFEDNQPVKIPKEKPILQRTTLPTNEEKVDEEHTEELVMTTTTTTTSKPRTRGRVRLSTTRRPLQSTSQSRATIPASHRPPQRVYPRRQRPKIRLRTGSTTELPDSQQQQEAQESVVSYKIRRVQRKSFTPVPPNHKPFYTPLTSLAERMDDLTRGIISLKRQPRLITPDIIRFNRTQSEDVIRPGEIHPRRYVYGTRSKHAILSRNPKSNATIGKK